MPIAEKAAALLVALTRDDFDSMAPAQRRRFADLCRHVAKVAEPPAQSPTSGVLHDLRTGARHE